MSDSEKEKFRRDCEKDRANEARWREWTPREVRWWVCNNFGPEEAWTFFEEEVDGSMLESLSDEELKELGMKLGQRKRFYTRLTELKKHDQVCHVLPSSRRPF